MRIVPRAPLLAVFTTAAACPGEGPEAEVVEPHAAVRTPSPRTPSRTPSLRRGLRSTVALTEAASLVRRVSGADRPWSLVGAILQLMARSTCRRSESFTRG